MIFKYWKKLSSVIFLVFVTFTSSAFAMSDAIRRDHDNECALYMCVPGGFISDSCRVPHQRFIERLTDINWKGGYNYTPLPNYLFCKSDENEENTIVNNAYAQVGQIAPTAMQKASTIDYVWRVDARVPEHKECRGWTTAYICTNGKNPNKEYSSRELAERKCSTNDQINYQSSSNVKKIVYCSSWETIPKHFVENTLCTIGYGPEYTSDDDDNFSYGRPNYKSSSTFKYDDKHQKVDSYNSPKWCDRSLATVGVTLDGKLYGQFFRENEDDDSVGDSSNLPELSEDDLSFGKDLQAVLDDPNATDEEKRVALETLKQHAGSLLDEGNSQKDQMSDFGSYDDMLQDSDELEHRQ